MAHFLQLVALHLFLLPPCLTAFPSGDSWDWISTISELDGAQFRDVASPLAQISANAYRYPRSVPIPSWTPSPKIAPVAPGHGGVHAVVYEQESVFGDNAPRVVLAFRGTQISASLDSLADTCADKILWEGMDFAALSEDCAPFDESTLDYYSQALNYTLQVLEAYPAKSLLLTGHSLGVGLAILVSAALSETYVLPVIGFGAPATQIPMMKRSLRLKALENGKVIVIAHQWDQIMRTQWEGQVGLLCLYRKQLSSACDLCFSPRKSGGSPCETDLSSRSNSCEKQEPTGLQSLSSMFLSDLASRQQRLQGLVLPDEGDCLDCFLETHYFKNLIEVVEQGDRPVCGPAVGLSHMEGFSQ